MKVLGRHTVFAKNFPSELLNESILSVQHNIQGKPGLVNVCLTNPNANAGESDTLHLSVWKPLVHSLQPSASKTTTLAHLAPEFVLLRNQPLVALLVCHGGQFSGGIFRCQSFDKPPHQRSKMDKHQIGIPIIHKTFHKYTTR